MGRNIKIGILAVSLFISGCTRVESDFAPCADSNVVLMPHHLIVERYINEMYGALARAQRPSKIIIISPDHFSTGDDGISTPDEHEHGFTIHRDLVSHYFDKLPVDGYMIRLDASEEDLIALAEKIAKENALIIFSIDFSHYLDGKIARIHDLMSRDVIESRTVADAQKLEVDSPKAVEVMLRTLELLDEKIVVYKNTNPALDAGIETFENTTHLFACSETGAPPPRLFKTSMYFAHSRDWYLGKTEEDRYLYGYDEMFFNQGGVDTTKVSTGEAETFDYFDESK